MRVLLVLLLFSSQAFARLGTDSSSGGGDGIRSEFRYLISSGLAALAQQGDCIVEGRIVDIGRLGQVLSEVKIETVDHKLYLRGKAVHAINYPEDMRIEIDGSAWENFDLPIKFQLGFHELWNIAFKDGADDQDRFSTEMARRVVIAALDNPNRILSVVSTSQNGRGQSFRALIVRKGGESRSNLRLIFQKIQSDGEADFVTSHVVYDPEELQFGPDTMVNDLRLESVNEYTEAFFFEVRSMIGHHPPQRCRYELPEPPAHEQLYKLNLICHGL